MLRALRVTDLAIIDEIELLLEPGFNVLTGETGAGKSILLQALDVALGGRPDADLVRTGADEAVVEALFEATAPEVGQALLAAGLPEEPAGSLLVRRVISRGGRTRAYVNGALASLGVLRDLAPHLVRVYGQDEHQALRRVESHRDLLDAAAGLARELDEMRALWACVAESRQALAAHHAAVRAARERVDLVRFQWEELDKAGLVPGEDDALAAERGRLAHAEKLGALVGGAEAGVYSGEASVVDTLGRALTALREAERLDSGLGTVRGVVDDALAQLEDAGGQLGRYLRTLAPDPARLEVVERRLAELGRLQRKYGGSVEELLRRRDDLAGELARATAGDEELVALATAAEGAEREARAKAERLTASRREATRRLERAVAGEFRELALDGARMTVRFGEARPLGPTGVDEIEFALAANPGEEPRPLARVASGGELSRIMLALKTVAASDDDGATLIFDEVDTGIGGRVAEVVGRKLQALGRRRQVLAVTHLPVIAAYASHHVVVAKRVVRGRTVSTATTLADGERMDELARMLGGARVTREAREHARELLRQGKSPPKAGAAAGK
jgi:DNA repair protein RecN (Recombination protein N)